MNLPLLFMLMILPLNAIIAGSNNDTLPFTFKAGDTARAASVNDNFSYLLRIIRQNEDRIDSLANVTTALNDSIRKVNNNLQLPIGTILGSILNPDQFQQIFPGDASLWKLADSSAASVEFYAATLNSNIPDLRGIFLRGINCGKKGDTAFIDPDGDRKAGSFQRDMLKSHNHTLRQYIADPSYPSGVWNVFDNTNRTYNTGGTDYTGGAETRPKNVGVYWYVKVK
jgi:hypothetical protein